MNQREIKFRAWDKREERMGEVSIIGFGFSNCFDDWNDDGTVDVAQNSTNIILMQYTGLKDKNGVEIYEGDILKYPWGIYDIAQVCVGEYAERDEEYHYGWYIEDAYVGVADSIQSGIDVCEVIGNIHENPKLLDVKEG